MGAGMGEFEGLVGRRVGLARRARPAGNRRAWTFGWIPEEELVRRETGHRDFWDRYSADPDDWAGAATPQRTRHGWVRGPGEPPPARAAGSAVRPPRASPAVGSQTPGGAGGQTSAGPPAGVHPRPALRVDVGKAVSGGDASPVSVLSPYAAPPAHRRGGRRAQSAGPPAAGAGGSSRGSGGRRGGGTANFLSQGRDDAKKRFHGEFEGVLASPGTPPPGAYSPDFGCVLERTSSADLSRSFQTGGCPLVTEQTLGNSSPVKSRRKVSGSPSAAASASPGRGPRARAKQPEQQRYGSGPESPSRRLGAYRSRLGGSRSETDVGRQSPRAAPGLQMDERSDAGRLLDEVGGGSTFSKPSPMTPEYAAFLEHKLRVYKPQGGPRGVRRGLAFD